MATKIKSNRKQLAAKFRTKRDQALVIIGRQAVGFVKLLVPVDSGFLRSSVAFATADTKAVATREPGKKGKNIGKTVTAPLDVLVEQPGGGHVVIGTNVHYAPHIEYGTRTGTTGQYTAGQPFLRPGVLNNKQILAATYAKAMKGL